MNEVRSKFLFETLTPLSITSGESYNKLEYILKDGFLYIFDLDKILEKIISKERDTNKVLNIMKNNLDKKLIEIINIFGLRFEDLRDAFKFKIKCDINELSGEVKTFIRHPNGKIYIPGSSIKGALRTPFYIDETKGIIHKEINYQKIKELKKTINEKNEENKIHLSDIEGDFDTTLNRIKRIGMGKGAKLNYIETLEILSENKPEIEIAFSLKNFNSLKDIIKKVNSFYLSSLNVIVKKIPKDEVDFKNNLEKLIQNIEKEIDCSLFLQLGFGGIYYTKSIGINFENEDPDLFNLRKMLNFGKKGRIPKKPFPKTYTALIHNNSTKSMGWVKLTPLD